MLGYTVENGEFPYNEGFNLKNRLIWCSFWCLARAFHDWSPAFFHLPRMLPPGCCGRCGVVGGIGGLAQVTTGWPVTYGVPDISIVTGTPGVAPQFSVPPANNKIPNRKKITADGRNQKP